MEQNFNSPAPTVNYMGMKLQTPGYLLNCTDSYGRSTVIMVSSFESLTTFIASNPDLVITFKSVPVYE